MTDDEPTLLQALRTTGACRPFTDEPVSDVVLARVLDTARFAPSGGNQQGWRVVVVRDPEARERLRDLYLPGWYDYLAMHVRSAAAGGGGFAEDLDRVPVLLALFVDLSVIAAVDRDHERYTFAGGASIYPFAWNLLLAARAEGLGGVITTMAIRREDEVKALLHAPADTALAAVIALGHPVHQPTRLTRDPVAEFATIDSFDGPVLAG